MWRAGVLTIWLVSYAKTGTSVLDSNSDLSGTLMIVILLASKLEWT